MIIGDEKLIIYSGKRSATTNLIEWGLTLLINGLVLLFATSVFRDFYVESFWYAILAAFVIMVLNKTLKPFIKLLTLPLTIFTLGLFYPFVNVIILKLASLIMGDKFIVTGWIIPFFIAIFISAMTIILDAVITRQIVGAKQ